MENELCSPINKFMNELSNYYWHENDLSNITVAFCNSNDYFKEKFLHFFFPNLNIEDVENIKREVWDSNGASSRVDIHILMKSNDKYIIEVKKDDKNHHFRQYEKAFGINKVHFGYITNYYCTEGISLGYDVKTWGEFYDYISELDDSSKLKGLPITAYLVYLKNTCNIIRYTEIMNFKSLKTIPQFFDTMDSIAKEEAHNLQICPQYQRKGQITWTYSYKEFCIHGIKSKEDVNGMFLLLYDANFVSIGIPSCKSMPITKIEKEEKNVRFKFTNKPSIDSDWWGYLWYELSNEALNKFQESKNIEEQKTILREYLKEVINSIRKYECSKEE